MVLLSLLFICFIAFFTLALAPATSCSSAKARRISCSSNLRQIGIALKMYAQDNKEFYPPYDDAKGLEMLRAGGYLENVKMYTCPSTEDNIFDNNELRDDECSFVYRSGMGTESGPNVAIAWDRSSNHNKYGNILYADGHVSGSTGANWMQEIKPSQKPEARRTKNYQTKSPPMPKNQKHLDAKHILLFNAVKDGNLEVTKKLIEQNLQLLHATDEEDRTLICQALNREHYEIIKYLLEKGADLNDAGGFLRYAAKNGNMKMVKFLVENKVDVNSACACGDTALMEASEAGKTEIIEYLILNNAPINLMNNEHLTALDHAYDTYERARYKDTKIIEFLRKYGAKKGSELKNTNQEPESGK